MDTIQTLKNAIKALRNYAKQENDMDIAFSANWLAKEYWLILMEVK